MLAAANYLGPATVLELNEEDQLVLVQLQTGGELRRSWARPAIVSSCGVKLGEVALVISQNMVEFYIIGWLEAVRPAWPHAATVETKSGARMSLDHRSNEEVLQLHSKAGDLIVEHHPESGKTRVNVESGDLEFVARNGSIAFHAAQDIHFGARAVNILSRWGTALGVLNSSGKITSVISLQPEMVKITSPEIQVAA